MIEEIESKKNNDGVFMFCVEKCIFCESENIEFSGAFWTDIHCIECDSNFTKQEIERLVKNGKIKEVKKR